MNQLQKKKLVTHLSQFLTPRRLDLMHHVLDRRTRYLTVVLEDIFHPHNASAVLRNCDCFGIQDVHVVVDRHDYRISPDVVKGAAQWLTLHKYSEETHQTHGSIACIETLRAQGYKIAATTLRPESVSLRDVQLDSKTALFFGTEEHGLSEIVHDAADLMIYIPMEGFTQSYNISVSASLCLYELTEQMRNSAVDWRLTEAEQTDLMVKWLHAHSSINGDAMMRHFFREEGLPIPPEFWVNVDDDAG